MLSSLPKLVLHRGKRHGRGFGSGKGGHTTGRGTKGQKARSGDQSPRPGFEGGQMPLVRRTPKRGFTNIFKKEYEIVNIVDLNRFENGEVVDINTLIAKRLIRNGAKMVKILGNGELKKKLIIKVNKISKQAIEKIKAASGEVK